MLVQILRDADAYHEIHFESNAEYDQFMSKHDSKIIPMFFKTENSIELITGLTVKSEKHDSLIYLMKPGSVLETDEDGELVEED